MSLTIDKSDALSKIIDIRCTSGLTTTANLLSMLKSASSQNRVEIFYSGPKIPIAYVAWANVNKESLLLMSKTRQMPTYPYEWNEGKLPVVYDLVFAPGWNDYARAEVLSFLFQNRFFAFLKKNRLHVFSRVNGKFKRKLF